MTEANKSILFCAINLHKFENLQKGFGAAAEARVLVAFFASAIYMLPVQLNCPVAAVDQHFTHCHTRLLSTADA